MTFIDTYSILGYSRIDKHEDRGVILQHLFMHILYIGI